MKAHNEELSIDALPQSLEESFIAHVKSFYVDESSASLATQQQEGATAVVDLAAEFEKFGTDSQIEHCARVIGRLSDIQVRDFALGSHNRNSFQTYWSMWHHLLQIAPTGFVAPVACLFATLAYERGDTTLAFKALDRASQDQPNYSLSILLRRVFGSGWPAGAFAAMRVELHPKVTAGIFG